MQSWNTESFCRWLMGYLEGMAGSRATLSKEQVDLVRLRLEMAVGHQCCAKEELRPLNAISQEQLAAAQTDCVHEHGVLAVNHEYTKLW